ncbi:MAG: DUF6778 family protein [Sedimentitalea sp.]
MPRLFTLSLIGAALTVSGCGMFDFPTRNKAFETPVGSAIDVPAGYQPVPGSVAETVVAASQLTGQAVLPGKSPVRVRNVTVTVPRELKVSESNGYLPRGDIVWRGDPPGDRYAQVQTIVSDALTKGVEALDGASEVDVAVQVEKFHALTEKARYTTGGVHAITFLLSVTDAQTGQLVVPTRSVRADLDGYGGEQALRAEARGETQKVRITAHLQEVIRQELTRPEGYKNTRLGVIQALNYQ